MNLKLVAAMSVLGLVSCPVLADTATTNQAPMPKHHAHHMMATHHHHHQAPVNYKEAVPAPVVCTVSQNDVVMDLMTQNAGRSLPNPCNPGWFNRIALSGGINVDAGKFGNRTARYMGVNYQTLSLNDAYFNLSATINDWTKAFVSISYNTATINDPTLATISPFVHVPEYSSAYDNNVVSGSQHALQLEQGYFTIGNMDAYPVFLQVGKQFQDFSRYEIHPITRSLTQVMSETLATSAKLGFIAPMGLNGSIFVFDDPIAKVNQAHRQADYGVSLGFAQSTCELGWDVGAAWLYNLMGVNDVAYNVGQWELSTANLGAYNSRVSGVAVYADVNSGPFTVGARWTAATQRFNNFDLPKNGVADTLPSGAVNPAASGAKPWAAGIQAGYSFDGLWDRNQLVYLGYQASREAAGLQLPRDRWIAGVGIDAWKNTNFVLEWNHDNGYNSANGGNGNNDNVVTIRAAVKFG